MYETYQMQEHICKELEKKNQSGIKSTTDLDTIWKLIDAYKNLLKIDMLQEASEYSPDGGYSQDGGYSERRHRDSRGRYSRDGDGIPYGNSYRRGYSRDGGTSMHECMEKLREELHEMMENAQTREERDKIKGMLREIGNIG